MWTSTASLMCGRGCALFLGRTLPPISHPSWPSFSVISSSPPPVQATCSPPSSAVSEVCGVPASAVGLFKSTLFSPFRPLLREDRRDDVEYALVQRRLG